MIAVSRTPSARYAPALVALDVDGTLADSEGRISERVRKAVLAHYERGAHVVLSTGRSVHATGDVITALGLDDGHAVASNGAVLFAYHPVEVIRTVTFDASQAVRRVLEQVPDAIVAVEDLNVGYWVSRPFPSGEISGQFVADDIDAVIDEPVTRVVVRAPEYDEGEFAGIVRGLGLTGTNYYIGYTSWVDLTPLGVSKQSGLRWLCERLGVVADDVLAAGDGNNDYEMLQWAGRGVAMSAAPQRVHEVADDVTGSVEEDGLARELERWL